MWLGKFPVNLMAIIAIGLMGALIALRLRLVKFLVKQY